MVDNYALYNGGNYFLNEYFANFGPSGIILSAVIFGLVVSKANKIIAGESSDIWLGLCAAFVIAMPRSMWYWQGNWINAILGFIVSYILYFVIMNIYTEINNNLVADAQESRP
jgi:hypothetical protein